MKVANRNIYSFYFATPPQYISTLLISNFQEIFQPPRLFVTPELLPKEYGNRKLKKSLVVIKAMATQSSQKQSS